MFEVFSRHMLVMTADVALKVSPEEYAQMVAGGYRPPKPNKMDEEVYALIEWCWRVSLWLWVLRDCSESGRSSRIAELVIASGDLLPASTSHLQKPLTCIIEHVLSGGSHAETPDGDRAPEPLGT